MPSWKPHRNSSRSLTIIHFLNVRDGACSVIQHNSGRVTVMDICNGNDNARSTEEDPLRSIFAALPRHGTSGGNFQQKKHPVNPLTYMQDRDISRIFRYVQSHPDMDHMDGIKALFEVFKPQVIWDTNNRKEMAQPSWGDSPYSEEDWKFYKDLRDRNPRDNPRRLTLLSGQRNKFWNVGQDGLPGGDGLFILAPTRELVEKANAANDYNECSYVLLYREDQKRVVFGGDSHDSTWEHILAEYGGDVAGVDLLIAPHHGRRSGRSYEFLDTLRPTLTFFGNAPSKHLAYDAWRRRGLAYVTNNQANCMVVLADKVDGGPLYFYVTNRSFAERVNPNTFDHIETKAWYVGRVTEELSDRLPQ